MRDHTDQKRGVKVEVCWERKQMVEVLNSG